MIPPLGQNVKRNYTGSWWGERGDWKSCFTIQYSKTMIMASGPITSWQIEGGKLEAVINFIFLGWKITANSDCSHEIKTLALRKKNYDNPRQCIKKQRYHFDNKGLCNQRYVFFLVVMFQYENIYEKGWVLKNWCFQIVVMEKTLTSPLDSRSSKQSILKEISPE